MYDEILYDIDDPVAVVTLNRPASLNAWTTTMDGSRLRFVTMVPVQATGARQIPQQVTASPECESAPKPSVAACLRAPRARVVSW